MTLTGVLEVDQADQVVAGSVDLEVKAGVEELEVEDHAFHKSSEEAAVVAAEAAPTMAAVAMNDFILILELGSRKSDCGQILSA